MGWTRDSVQHEVDGILSAVFGVAPGTIAGESSFAGDLMAESLDYVDIGLHITNRFGIPFDFAEAAREIRNGGAGAVRVRDLVDHLTARLGHA